MHLSRSDQLRCTTWLHPRTGEPVNSGHMIRSGGRWVGGGTRGAPRLRDFDQLFSPSRRLAARLGGGLHGGGRQLLHRVSEPAPRPHLACSPAALADLALGVYLLEGGGLGDGCVPGFLAPQGAWPGPARRWPSQQTPGLPGHASPGGMRWEPWRVSGSRTRRGSGVWPEGLGVGEGKRGPDAGLAAPAGLAVRAGSRPRPRHPCFPGMGWGWGSQSANDIPGTLPARLRRAPNAVERGRSALPGLVEQELCRLCLWALSQQLFWVFWAAWI